MKARIRPLLTLLPYTRRGSNRFRSSFILLFSFPFLLLHLSGPLRCQGKPGERASFPSLFSSQRGDRASELGSVMPWPSLSLPYGLPPCIHSRSIAQKLRYIAHFHLLPLPISKDGEGEREGESKRGREAQSCSPFSVQLIIHRL